MDKVINSILDSLLETTGIDPAWMEPDYRLRADLSMTQSDIDKFLKRLIKDMGLPADFAAGFTDDLSLRQICDQVKLAMVQERRAG